MSEIRTHDEVIGIVGILAQEAYDDCDAGREQLGAQTNQAIEWLIATDAALRLALETATARAQSLSNELLDAIHARDNHRDRAATVSLMLDTIEGVATGQPGEIPTAVEDGWSTALGAVLALVRERDEWKAQAETAAAWARKTIEERDALLSRHAPPADAATEAVRMLRHLCNVYGCTSYGRTPDHGPDDCSWCEAEALLAALAPKGEDRG